jgi:hypothetical protein
MIGYIGAAILGARRRAEMIRRVQRRDTGKKSAQQVVTPWRYLFDRMCIVTLGVELGCDVTYLVARGPY